MSGEDHGRNGEADRDLGVKPQQGSAGPALRVCPNCGASLADRSCKLVCPNPACGYYLSCSDYV
jgi:hypothetical protein